MNNTISENVGICNRLDSCGFQPFGGPENAFPGNEGENNVFKIVCDFFNHIEILNSVISQFSSLAAFKIIVLKDCNGEITDKGLFMPME